MNQIIDIKLKLKGEINETRKQAWLAKSDEERRHAVDNANLAVQQQLNKAFEDFDIIGLDITVLMNEFVNV